MQNIFKCKLSVKGEILEVSAPLADYLGYSAFELHNLSVNTVFKADDKEDFLSKAERLLDARSPELNETFKGFTRNGEQFSVLIHGVLVRSIYGKPDYISCSIFNYGEMDKTREKLSVTEQQFESLFYDNPLAVYSIDQYGNFERANRKLYEVSGYTKEEIESRPFLDFLVESDKDMARESFKEAIAGKSGTYEIGVRTKAGKTLHLHVTNFPRFQNDKVVGIYGFLYDVTIPIESIDRWELLIKQTPQPVQIIQDGKIVFINQIGAEYYGASSPDELIGFPLIKLSHPDSQPLFEERYKQLSNGQEIEAAEHKILTVNGDVKYIRTHSKPIKYQGFPAIQTVFYDITEEKEQHNKIRHSLKQKDILVKEIHHRVKNNLAVITSLLELQIINSQNNEVKSALRDSQHRIDAIATIHEQLYQDESLTEICLGQHITNLVAAIHDMYRLEEQQITINVDYDEIGLGIIQSVPCSLIVNEVIVNSFKHGFRDHRSGNIDIHCRNIDKMIEIEIVDDGTGLPEDFSMSSSTSLGTTLIQSLSEHMHGTAEYLNRDGAEGTRFILRFSPDPYK